MKNNLLQITMVVAWLLLGLYVLLQIITGGFNSIGQFFLYATIGLAILGFMQARLGFWVLAVSFGYLDMLKRFLILEDYVSYYDVALVLALAPILAVSIYTGLVARAVLSQRNMRKGEWTLILAAAGVAGFLGATSFFSVGGGLGGLGQAANYGAYATLIYTVPTLFPMRADLWKMLKVVTLLFVPTALYAYWQYFNGLSWWEIEYLETGLSGEARILFGQEYRIFSTLNSSQNLCKVMSVAAILALVIPWRNRSRKSLVDWMISLALFALFIGAAYGSGSRTGLVMGFVLIAAYFVFRFKLLTAISYVLFGATLLATVIFAERLIQNEALLDWQTNLRQTVGAESEGTVDRTRLTTLTIRFESLATLKDPRTWTPFGEKLAGVDSSNQPRHDVISDLLRNLGFIPLGLIVFMGMIMVCRLHLLIWREEEYRNLRLVGLGLISCVLVGALSAHGNLQTFPINAFLYMGGGIVAGTIVRWREAMGARAGQAVGPTPAMPPLGPAGQHGAGLRNAKTAAGAAPSWRQGSPTGGSRAIVE